MAREKGGFAIGLCIVVFYPLTRLLARRRFEGLLHRGTQRVYDHYGKRFRPLPRTDVVVRAGTPVDLAEFRQRPMDGPLLREVTDRVMSQIRDLLAEVRREPAPTGFFSPVHPGQCGEQAS